MAWNGIDHGHTNGTQAMPAVAATCSNGAAGRLTVRGSVLFTNGRGIPVPVEVVPHAPYGYHQDVSYGCSSGCSAHSVGVGGLQKQPFDARVEVYRVPPFVDTSGTNHVQVAHGEFQSRALTGDTCGTNNVQLRHGERQIGPPADAFHLQPRVLQPRAFHGAIRNSDAPSAVGTVPFNGVARSCASSYHTFSNGAAGAEPAGDAAIGGFAGLPRRVMNAFEGVGGSSGSSSLPLPCDSGSEELSPIAGNPATRNYFAFRSPSPAWNGGLLGPSLRTINHEQSIFGQEVAMSPLPSSPSWLAHPASSTLGSETARQIRSVDCGFRFEDGARPTVAQTPNVHVVLPLQAAVEPAPQVVCSAAAEHGEPPAKSSTVHVMGQERSVFGQSLDQAVLVPVVEQPNLPPKPQAPRPSGCTELEIGLQLKKIKKRLQMAQSMWAERDDKVARLVEAVRQVTEALVWGERHDGSLFDLFCEHQMLASFVAAVHARATPGVLKVQLLQSLQILVQNARRPTSSFYLLSGGLLNTLFDDPPDLGDEEVLAYFVALLKGVAMRLDSESVCLFLAKNKNTAGADSDNKAAARLPIFERAVTLASHSDSMVKTAARTALMCILRLDAPYVREVAAEIFQRHLASGLAVALRAAARPQQPDLPQSSAAGGSHEDVEDLKGFVADLVALDVPAVTQALATELGGEETLSRLLPDRSSL